MKWGTSFPSSRQHWINSSISYGFRFKLCKMKNGSVTTARTHIKPISKHTHPRITVYSTKTPSNRGATFPSYSNGEEHLHR